MKRKLALVMTGILAAMSLAACGGSQPAATTAAAPGAAAPAAAIRRHLSVIWAISPKDKAAEATERKAPAAVLAAAVNPAVRPAEKNLRAMLLCLAR